MTSTGVYFKSPAPFGFLPELPGDLVKQIESDTPIMVGEFKGDNGGDYTMVVNLSLQRSVNFKIILQGEERIVRMVNSAGGELIPLNPEGYWLVAGQGVFLKLD